MPVYVQWPTSGALVRRLDAIADAAAESGPRRMTRQSRGRALAAVRSDLEAIVRADHVDKMLSGIDRYGRPRAPLAKSTLKRPRSNPNSLIPRGVASRFITNYEADWEGNVLVQRFRDIVSRKGRSFAQYHLTGATRPGTRWVLPKRDVAGITPKGWAQVVKRHTQFARDVLDESRTV